MRLAIELLKMAMEYGDAYMESNTVADLMYYGALNKGWSAKREYKVTYNGRKGKIDLFVWDGIESVAIEVDRGVVKSKSIDKLRKVDATTKICIITRSQTEEAIEGVDLIASIRDRTYTTKDGLIAIP